MLPAAFLLLSIYLVLSVAWVLRRVLAEEAPGEANRRALRVMAAGLTWGAAWLGVAATGVLARSDLRPPPFAGVLVVTLVAAVGFAGSRAGRALSQAPLGVLVGLQAFRLPLELVMAHAASQGVMPVQMSLHGRNFDVVTGLLALGMGAWSLVRPLSRAAAWVFQLVGVTLLVNILTIAVASTPMFHAFGTEPAALNTFVFHPPYVLLPTVLVAGAIALHVCLLRRLRA